MKGTTPRVERVLAAFLVSPMAGVALITAFVWLTVRVPDLKLLIGVCLLYYPIALVPGIPGYFLLRRLGLLRRAHWTLLFSTTSGALSAILALLFRVPHAPGAVGIVGTAILGLLAGALSGFAFAAIIRVRRPLQDDVAAIFD